MSDTDTNIFFYNPSLPAAIVLTVMYGLLATWHFYSCIIKPHNLPEKHRYTIPLFVAAAISTVGFAVRAAATNDVSNIGLYAPQASLIIISPIFVCASLYLLLANLVRRCLPDVGAQKLFGIGPHWLGRIFIASDIVAFLTQCSGSGIAASSNWEGSTKDIGVYILIAGLAIQLATFSLFLLLLWKFFFKVNTMFGWFSPNSKTVVVEMWIAGACVEIRSIYRVVEFGLGIEGYPFQHEWPLYVFEALPIFITIGVLGCFHPVRLLQDGNSSNERTKRESTSQA